MNTTTKEKKSVTEKKHPPRFREARKHHGVNMAFWRIAKGLSQTELANKLNKTQQYVSQLEKSPIIENEIIEEVAAALEIDPQNITDWMTDGSINIFDIDQLGEGERNTNMVGTYNFETNHKVDIHPIDKVCEIYQQMIDILKNQLEKSQHANREEIQALMQVFTKSAEIQNHLLEEIKNTKKDR